MQLSSTCSRPGLLYAGDWLNWAHDLLFMIGKYQIKRRSCVYLLHDRNLTAIDHTHNFEVQPYPISIFDSFTASGIPYNRRPMLLEKFMNVMSPYYCYSENILIW